MPGRLFVPFLSHVATATALGAALVMAAPAAFAQPQDHRRMVSVEGEGIVTARPDTAHITAGVVTDADTARQALDDNSTQMAKVMETLTAAGIAADDIRTSNFAITPLYSRPARAPGEPHSDPQIVGYRATNTVTVTVRDLDALGPTLDSVVTSGANTIDAVAFFLDKPQALMDEARQIAIDDALRRASILAAAAGADLGRVLKIMEHDTPMPQPIMMRQVAMQEASAVPMAPGTLEMHARVRVVIALE